MLRSFVILFSLCTGLYAESAWDLLNQAAQNHSETMRLQAVLAISSIGLQPRALQMVEHACSDTSEDVRRTAAQQLGELNSRHSIPALTKLLDDPNPSVAFTAAQALWKMKDYAGRKLIAAVLDGEGKSDAGAMHGMMHDAQGKLQDRAGLVKLGLNEGAGMLLGPFALPLGFAEDLFKDKGAPARVMSASLLAKDSDPATLRDLEAALNDKNPAVRAAAAKALGERGRIDEVPRLEPLLTDKRPATRLFAAAAIARLQGSQSHPDRRTRPAGKRA